MNESNRFDALPADVQGRVWTFDLVNRLRDYREWINGVRTNAFAFSAVQKRKVVSFEFLSCAAFCGVNDRHELDEWMYSHNCGHVMVRFAGQQPLFCPPSVSWGMRLSEFRSVLDSLQLEATRAQITNAALKAPYDYYQAQWWSALDSEHRNSIAQQVWS